MSDYVGDDLTNDASEDSDEFLDRQDWEPPQAEEPLAEPFDVLEPEPAPAFADPFAVVPIAEEQPPQVSIEQQIVNAARVMPAAPSAPARPAYSQEHLLQIAQADPERYAELRELGHKLERIPWGPDR